MQPRASTPKRGAFHLRRESTVSPGSGARLIAFNKPYGVICQFTPEAGHKALSDYIAIPHVYPAGRLDTDSEGMLMLTDHGPLQNRISSPKHKLVKTYWAQVEGLPDDTAIARLCEPLDLGDFVTQRCQAKRISEPAGLWERDPPIRHRAAIPTAWLEIRLTEGKNRQVRRMTAKVGFPTLRLIRAAIGSIQINKLAPGQWRDVNLDEIGYSK